MAGDINIHEFISKYIKRLWILISFVQSYFNTWLATQYDGHSVAHKLFSIDAQYSGKGILSDTFLLIHKIRRSVLLKFDPTTEIIIIFKMGFCL